MKTNNYFLAFSQKTCATMQDARIPPGYVLYLYREVYIPASDTSLYYRGSGTNPATMDVPIHYIANPGELRRAIRFLNTRSLDK